MTKKSDAPAIRFKGFSDAWEQRKLGEIGSVSMCRRIFKEQTSETGDIPFYKIGTFGADPDAFISRELFEEYKSKYPYPQKGDILISASGSIGRTVEFAGNNEYFQDSNIVWLNHDERLSNPFLKCFYSVVKWAGIEGSTIKRLYNDNILNTVICMPSVPEQKRIGLFFENLDNLITLHQRKCVFLFGFFQAFISMIFTASTFSWEQRKVGDLLIERNQQAPMSDEYPLMAFIANEGVAPKGERYDRSALVTDTVNKLYKKTEKGDFIYSSNNLETGSIGLNKYGKACISPVYSIFEPTGIADSDFLGRRLVRKDFINAMVKWRQGVIYGQWRIHESDFLKIEIPVPSVEEQRKIGAYLDQLDNLITLHQRQHFLHSTPDISLSVRLIHPFYTSSWEQRKLSEITDKVTEKNAGLQYVETFTNSAEFGIISQRDFFDHDIAKLGSLDGYYIVKNEDFVYNPRISTSAPVGPINRNKLGRTGVMSPLYTVFRPHDIDTTYLEYFFKCGYWHSFMNFNGDSGARSDRFSIRDNVFFQMPIPIPDIDEQRKIGELLTCLDNLITLHQRKFEKLTNVKKSMLEKMFPQNGSSYPEIRFKGFTDPWEQRKVQDVADRFDNLRIPVAANLRVHGTTPYYGANGIQDYVEGFTHDGEFVLVAEDGANDLKNYPVKCVNGRIWVNNHAHILQGKAGIADNSFLAFAISQSDIESLLVGGGRAKLNAETLMSIEFRLPCLQEQYRIGEYLTQLDHLITLHQRELEKLQNIKKSMLEKMFV